MESKGREVIKKTSNLIGGLYGLLTSPNAEVDKTKAKDIVANLEKLGNYLGEGPYFYGKDFSWVDVYFAPFFHRFSFLLPYYRDFDIF